VCSGVDALGHAAHDREPVGCKGLGKIMRDLRTTIAAGTPPNDRHAWSGRQSALALHEEHAPRPGLRGAEGLLRIAQKQRVVGVVLAPEHMVVCMLEPSAQPALRWGGMQMEGGQKLPGRPRSCQGRAAVDALVTPAKALLFTKFQVQPSRKFEPGVTAGITPG